MQADEIDDRIIALEQRVGEIEQKLADMPSRLADEAWLDLNTILTARLSATDDDAERAAILKKAIEAVS